MSIVYVDLDGVLADFDSALNEIRGGEELSTEELWVKVAPYGDGLYACLELMPDASKLWNWISVYFDNIQILTAIPRRSTVPTAEADKRAWVATNFGTNIKVNIGPYARDKQKHCKPGDILIDDKHSNIAEWVAKGGIGILHTSASDTIKQLTKLIKDGTVDPENYGD